MLAKTTSLHDTRRRDSATEPYLTGLGSVLSAWGQQRHAPMDEPSTLASPMAMVSTAPFKEGNGDLPPRSKMGEESVKCSASSIWVTCPFDVTFWSGIPMPRMMPRKLPTASNAKGSEAASTGDKTNNPAASPAHKQGDVRNAASLY